MSQHAVAIDQVSKVFTVRIDSQNAPSSKRFRQRLREFSGTKNATVEALQTTSLLVDHGESVGVIGTNGSGKSTLMKLLAGHLIPTSGTIHASSKPVLLGVNAALVPSLSGEDNIRLGCLALGMTEDQIETKREMILHISGLTKALRLPLKSYSSGMAARLQFAIATAVDPEILIVDEALNTGDAQFKQRTAERIDELRSQAGCVLLVSHSLQTIKQMCSRVIWLEQGELIADGEPDVITRAYYRYTMSLSKNKATEAASIMREVNEQLAIPTFTWH